MPCISLSLTRTYSEVKHHGEPEQGTTGIQERNMAFLRGLGYQECATKAAAAAGMDPWSETHNE